MAISDFDVSRVARCFAAAQLLNEAKANDPRGVGASEEGRAAMWTAWSELLAIAERAKHSDIPAAGARITLSDRVRAARVVVEEVEPRAREDVILGLHIFQMAQYAFDKIVADYDPGGLPLDDEDEEVE